MKWLLALGLLASSGCALGAGAIGLDYGSTVVALHHGLEEQNPLLGPRPSTLRLATYNAVALSGYTLAYRALPRRERRWFAITVTVVELAMVVGNLRAVARAP